MKKLLQLDTAKIYIWSYELSQGTIWSPKEKMTTYIYQEVSLKFHACTLQRNILISKKCTSYFEQIQTVSY